MRNCFIILCLLLALPISSFAQFDLSSLYYDSSKSYPKGEEVLLESDPSEIYTSKVDVPAGFPPPNSTYWSTSTEHVGDLTSTYSNDLSNVPSSENIEDVNVSDIGSPPPDEPPTFAESVLSVGFTENSTAEVAIIAAVNADSYSLSEQYDYQLFDFNQTSQKLRFLSPPDYESLLDDNNSDGVYTVVILATNDSGTTDQTIYISINNVVETPVFSDGTSISVNFTSGSSGSIYTASATDGSIYSISGGADSNLFSINSATGAVTSNSISYNEQGSNAYSIIITASNDISESSLNLTVNVIQPDGSGSEITFNPGFRRDGSPMDPSIPVHFDVDGYYDRNHDVRDVLQDQPNDGVLAYDHYISNGIAEDRMFDNNFVPLEYLNINTDLRVVFTDDNGVVDLVAAVNHWFTNGMSEGRVGRFAMPDWFDAQQYMDNHNDVRDALDDDSPFGKETEAWWHFYRIGAPQENRSWNDEEFTLDAYIALNQDVSVEFKKTDGTMDKKAAMYHYIYAGNDEGRDDTFTVPTWFDSNEYLNSNSDVAGGEWGASPFKAFNHFFRYGAPVDNRTISTFSLDAYIAHNTDVVNETGGDRAQILIHYIAYGYSEGRKATDD